MAETDFTEIEDLVVVGGGVSGTLALIHTLQKLADCTATSRARRMTIFDKNGDFGGGLAYGRRSGKAALLISQLHASVPEHIYEDLIAYLLRTRDLWQAELADDPAGQAWLQRHHIDIANGNFAHLYVPRFLLQHYIQTKLDKAVYDAQAANLARIRIITAEVREIVRDTVGYRLQFIADGQAQQLRTCNIVLAVGIAPPVPDHKFSARSTFVANMYEPSISVNIARLTDAFEIRQKPSSLLIVGSNAAALEALYHIRHSPLLRSRLRHITVLSTSGRLPDPWRAQAPGEMQFPNLSALCKHTGKTDDDVMQAVYADIAEVRNAGFLTADFARPILEHVFAVLGAMVPQYQHDFMERHSAAIVRLVANTAGAEYLEAASDLQTDGIVTYTRGRYLQTHLVSADSYAVKYHNLLKNRTMQEQVQAVILCAGYPTLHASEDALIRSLLAKQDPPLRINQSQRGFTIDDDFQVAPGFFVLGPLLAGICNTRGAVFDLENAARLWVMSEQLATVLTHTLGQTA